MTAVYRWALMVAVTTALPIGGASAGDVAVPLAGLLHPRDSITTAGALYADEGPLWIEAHGVPRTEFASHQNLTGFADETRWQTVGGPGGILTTSPRSERRPLERMEQATLRIKAAGRDAQWAGVWDFPSDHIAAKGASCQVRDQEARPWEFEGGNGGRSRLAPWQAPPRELVADCRSEALEAVGHGSLLFDDAVLQVEYVTRGDPKPRSVELVTGTIVTPNATVPGVFDHVRRVVGLQAAGRSFSLAIHASATWTLHARSLGCAGEMTIPPGRGNLTWGDWKVDGLADSIAPRGLLDLEAPVRGGIAMSGFTANGPPLTHQGNPGWPTPPAAWLLAGGAAITAIAVVVLRGPALVVALFTRLTESAALRHARRRTILAFVGENAGCSLRELAHALSLPRRAVEYHTGVLRRQGLLVSRRVGRETILFPAEAEIDQPERLQQMRRPIVQALLAALQDRHALTHRELASRLGVTRQYVSKVLRALAAASLVSAEGPRGRRVYRIRSGTDPADP